MSIPFNPITISVGKKTLSSFISLQIEQNIGKHHRFQMAVELETGSNRYVHNINSSMKRPENIGRLWHQDDLKAIYHILVFFFLTKLQFQQHK